MTDNAALAAFCHGDRDGDCFWSQCPQLENWQTYCPLAEQQEKGYEEI